MLPNARRSLVIVTSVPFASRPLDASAFAVILLKEEDMGVGVLLVLVLIALVVWAGVLVSKKNKNRTHSDMGANYDYYRHGVNCECRDCLKNLR